MNLKVKSKPLIVGAGYLNAGYQYGLTPYALMDSTVGGYFSAEGNQQVSVFGAPINVAGRYSTLKNVAGLNNSIHVSFDAAAYREQLKQRAKQKAIGYKDSILNLQSLEQKYTQRLQYLQYLNSLSADQYAKKVPVVPEIPNVDSLIPKTDSLAVAVPSVAVPSYTLPSIQMPTGDNYKEDLGAIIVKQRLLLDSIKGVRNRFEQLQHLGDSLSALKNGEMTGAPQLPLLSRIRTLEVGLCYPMFSPFSLYGVPLRGVVTEYETGKMYFAAAGGKTISNILFTPNILENNISNVRNLYNFFAFTNVESGRTIATVRGGVGRKDANHLFVGLLWGKGLQSYWQDSTTTLNEALTEQNLVVDVDAAFKIGKSHQLSFNYAKSVIRNSEVDNEVSTTPQPKLQDVRYRSHALQLRYNGTISSTHTTLTGTIRWIDPYFRSYGSGFVRPDNVRFEIKAEQPITKKWRTQIMYRQEQNNLLGLYDQLTLLRSAGITLAYRGSSRFQFRALYQPIVQTVTGDSIAFHSDNQMMNASFTWRPKTGKWNSTITGLCGYYKLLDGTMNREYLNALFIYRAQSKKGWVLGVNYSLYSVTPADSLYSDNGIGIVESGYIGKNGFSIIGGYKLGHFSDRAMESGFQLQCSIPIWKHASIILEGQKLIRGDYFNMYSQDLFESFPYVFSTHLQLTW